MNLPTTATSSPAPIRVMVVEDHALLREGIAAVLSMDDRFQLVAEGATGREAIELFVRHAPDVTLMDLHMPVMTGLEAIRALRRLAPETVIIVQTLYWDEEIGLALQAGAAGYLHKGMLRTELLDAIQRAYAGTRLDLR